MRKWLAGIFFILLILPLVSIPAVNAEKGGLVYYADIEGSEVTKGLYEYIKRAVEEAEENGAETIIFEIDTPGGFVDAAVDIGTLLSNTEIETIAYINPDAISAGAYIALNMDQIYMSPQSNMGAAKVIDQEGNAADQKSQSYWRSKMRDAAEASGRDPIYALAMIDETIDLPEYDAPKGKLLTFTASEALEAGYAEGIAKNRSELLQLLGYKESDVENVEKSFAEKLAEFITNPIVVPILLSIASLGIIVELYSPGFGLPGIAGITALLLFFYGHFVAGLAGYESLIFFILGLILLIVELFIPGGIVGFIGFGSILLSIILAGGNIIHMAVSLLIAIVVAITTAVILVKIFGKRIRVFNRIILKDSTTTEEGYVSSPNRTELLNKVGVAITPLRPAGTVVIDNERIDAVTEGGFINSGTQVIVVEVEGVRIVVREYKD